MRKCQDDGLARARPPVSSSRCPAAMQPFLGACRAPRHSAGVGNGLSPLRARIWHPVPVAGSSPALRRCWMTLLIRVVIIWRWAGGERRAVPVLAVSGVGKKSVFPRPVSILLVVGASQLVR